MTAVSAEAPFEAATTVEVTRLIVVADPEDRTRLTVWETFAGGVHLKRSQLQVGLLTVTVKVE